MISVNACHPSFDLSMELLCCLPVRTCLGGAMVKEIVDDLGFRTGEFPKCLKNLKTRYEIEGFYLGGARHIAITPMGWTQARTAAQNYWDEVYGVPLARLRGLR